MENLNVDFRQIKPIKKYNSYRNDYEYLIPCKVLNIGEKINSRAYKITIERLDLQSGKLITVNAITFERTIQIFKELAIIPPFISECSVYIHQKFGISYVVYGIFNTSGIINIIENNVESSEEVLSDLFKQNYLELQQWINL